MSDPAENTPWNLERDRLEKELKLAALALIDHTQSGGFMLEMPGGPEMYYVAVGGIDTLAGLVSQRIEDEGDFGVHTPH